MVLTEPNPKFFARPDKSTPVQKNECVKQVEEKFNQGIIERSSAPWSSNCVLINKNGKTRIAVDYRKLNSYTVRDSYLLPTVQEIMDTLANKKWFTSVDCVQAYHQIPIKSERDKDLTTFVVPGGGLYRYKYMPFGLKNAGACWSRFIDNALGDLRWNICCVYADDILIVTESEDVEDHIKDLDKVFDKLDALGIKVRGDKIKLGVKELPFLGQIVGVDGVKPDPAKLKAIKDLAVPSTVHQLRRFLGMASYYRKFIKNFSDEAAPLYNLTKKNAQNKRLSNRQIAFSTVETAAFEKLKDLLTSEPIVLHFPDWGKEFVLHCDASDIGIGAVLYQKVGSDEKVVMYASRLLNANEAKYQSYQKEALALVWAVELFSHYVKGVTFTIVTDCRALLFLQNNPLNSRVARWVLRLQEYDFKIIHKAGARHVVPDTLSRQPNENENPYEEEEIESLYDNTKPLGSIFEENMDQMGMVLGMSTRSKKVTFNESLEPIDESTITKTNRKRKTPEPDLKEKEADLSFDTEPSLEQEMEEVEENVQRGFFGNLEDIMSSDKEVWQREQNSKIAMEEIDILKKRGVEFVCSEQSKLLSRLTRNTRRGKQREVDETVDVKRFYVPPSLRRYVLLTHHNFQMHGHQGGNRLKKMIGRKYYWPEMAKDAERHVASCLKCAKRKTVRLKGQGLIEPALANRPWEVVGIDLVGKCIESEKGNTWILTIVDHFSRYPIIVPLKDKSAETIAQALYENLICVHGSPKKILSDRAKELIASSIRVLYDKWGVRLATTGGYNPEANGACERFHRWLHSAITCTYDRKTRNWDDLLQPLQFAYRVSVNDVTGYSPYFLIHGREATLPLEACLSIDDELSEEGYVAKLTEGLSKAFSIAREQQFKAYMNNYAESRSREKPNFKKDDYVVVYRKTEKESRLEIAGDEQHLPTKWRNSWVGPGRFIQEVSNTEAQIELDGEKIYVHYNRLRKFRAWNDFFLISDEKEEKDSFLDEKSKKEKTPRSQAIEDIAREEPGVGDLVILMFEPDEIFKADYGIGEILKVNKNPKDAYHIQWYGNRTMSKEGEFKPGYYDPKDNKVFFQKKNTRNTHVYDNVVTETKIKRKELITWGFDLLDAKKHLTTKVKEQMEAAKTARKEKDDAKAAL